MSPAATPLARLARTQAWCDAQATRWQQLHLRARMAVLLLGLMTALAGALVVSLGLADGSPLGLGLKVLLVVLPLLAAVLSAALGRLNLSRKWVAFRAAAETLKSEAYLFATASEKYSSADREAVLDDQLRAVQAELELQTGVAVREGV